MRICFLGAVLLIASSASAQTGTIAGTVTDELTSAGLGPVTNSNGTYNFIVVACPTSATSCDNYAPTAASSYTDASGHYIIQNLSPGTYDVKTVAVSPYISEVYPDIPCAAQDCTVRQGTPVTVTAGVTTTIDVALGQGGSISGTITRADTGAGLYRQIYVYNSRGSQVRSIYTDYTATTKGTYTVGSLPAGSYYLRIAAPDSGSTDPGLSVLYSNVLCGRWGSRCPLEMGSTIVVTNGATTTVNIALPTGGSISGTVTASDTGAPVPIPSGYSSLVTVGATSGDYAGSASTDASGHYTISGLAPGRYYVSAHYYPPTYGATSPYADTYYGGACSGCASSGSKIAVDVTDSATTSSIDISLALVAPTAPGSITGNISTNVTTQWYQTAGNSRVAAYDAGGHFVGAATFTGSATPMAWPTGYTISNLQPGTYYVRFENPAYANKYGWAGGYTPDLIYGYGPCITVDCDVRRGAPVVVGTAAVTGVDFSITSAATINTGVLPYGAALELYDARGVRVTSTHAAASCAWGLCGPVSLVGLPDGTYYFRAADGRLNGGLSCIDCPATAGQPIVVTAGQSVTATLTSAPPGITISGTVRDADTGTPLSSISVGAYVGSTTGAGGGLSDATGYYSLPTSIQAPAGAGIYHLATGNTVGYADRLYDNIDCARCDPVLGTPLTVPASGAATVDFALHRGGVVQARLTDTNGVGLTQQAAIDFFDAAGHLAGRATQPNGSDTATVQLLPGTYYAKSAPVSGYVQTAYGTAINVTLVTPVSITIPIAACTPGDITPVILASAVSGLAYRQVFTPSTPNTNVYVTSGRLPAGLTLDPGGVLSGTPSESGVFNFSVSSIDASGCVFTRQYTLQVAKCAFTLSPDSATVGAAGGPTTVTASSVCGYSTVTSQATWITADATSASSSTPLTVNVDPNPAAASRVATITIGRRVFTVRQAGQGSSAPFGNYETPVDNAQVSGSIAVSGWALDDVQVTQVRILRDPVAGESGLVFVGNAVLVDGARPDVERVYPAYPFASRAGWGYLLLTSMLPNQGNGTFRIYAIADDAEGHSSTLGVKTVVCVNNAATVPFGAIDTPAQGQTVSGRAYRNWGWALTPQPKSIPTDGSTIQVLVDGASVGSTNQYNLFRSDVAGLFPGLANSGGSVGYRDIDTTALQEGVHTIAWVVTDTAGAGSGIGSRYFTVRNSADAQPAGLFLAPQTGQRAASLLSATGDTLAYRISPLQALRVSFASSTSDCALSYAGYLVANGELRDLPAGASLDRDGTFAWQPGPAFHGLYEFAIVTTDCTGATARRSLLVRVTQ